MFWLEKWKPVSYDKNKDTTNKNMSEYDFYVSLFHISLHTKEEQSFVCAICDQQIG